MTRWNDLNYRTRNTLKGWMITPIVLFVIFWAGAFAIDVLAIDDRNTLDEAQHTDKIPAGVIQLADDAYLIQDGADVAPLDICIGSTTEGEGARYTKKIPTLNGTYVGCYVPQQWGIAETKINPNLGEALGIAIQKTAFIWTLILGLAVTLLFPIFMGARELIARSIHSKKEKKVKRLNQNVLLGRYRAIQTSYSKDEIDDLQFDKKLQELVDAGFEMPDKGIFAK